MLDFEEMLIRTVTSIEEHNLTELLPLDVHAFWQARRAKEEAAIEHGRTEAIKFCERQVNHWREQSAAASHANVD